MRKAQPKCKLLLCLGLSALCGAGQAAAQSRHSGIPYAQPPAEPRQSLDLYLPASPGPAPLIALLHGSSWNAPDRQGLGEAAAEALSGAGLAVALVRFRLVPDHSLAAAQRDVARALAWLARSAPRYGYDPGRIVLAGHGAGGHIAALVGLDAELRRRHGVPGSVPAGVVALGAPLDLERWARRSPRHRAAAERAAGARSLASVSPLRRARAGAPPFLVLSAAREPRSQQAGARAFVHTLWRLGDDRSLWLSVAGRGFLDLLRFDDANPASGLVAGFVRGKFPGELGERIDAWRAWRRPPLSSEGFWEHRALVRDYPVDQRFYQSLLAVMPGEREQLNGWELERYYAIDLDAYLDAALDGARHRDGWVAITNVNGERIVWRRREIAAYGPRIVIGLDDERNLFRLAAFYRMRMEYSWREGAPPPLMARPLGAFVYFEKDRPERLRETIAGFTPQGIRLLEHDPLAPLAGLPAPLRALLSDRHNCVACHDFRGTGARAHHLTAAGARPHGGFALPLAGYPEAVLRRFLFDQKGLAREFGITANVLGREDAEVLYRLLIAEGRR